MATHNGKFQPRGSEISLMGCESLKEHVISFFRFSQDNKPTAYGSQSAANGAPSETHKACSKEVSQQRWGHTTSHRR